MENDNIDFIKRRVAYNVQGFRAVHHWTQEDLAKRAGVPRSNISYVESGLGNPSLEVIIRIANAFNFTLEKLLSVCQREFRHFKAHELIHRPHEWGQLTKVLPDEAKKFDVNLMEIQQDGALEREPHLKDAREYFYCLKGRIAVRLELDHALLEEGDVLVFSSDQKRIYTNYSDESSRGLSLTVYPSLLNE